MSKLEWKKRPEICMQRLRDVVSSWIIRQSIWYHTTGLNLTTTLNPYKKPAWVEIDEDIINIWLSIWGSLVLKFQANQAAQKYEWDLLLFPMASWKELGWSQNNYTDGFNVISWIWNQHKSMAWSTTNSPWSIPSMTSNVNSLLTSRGSLHCGDGQSCGYPIPLQKALKEQISLNYNHKETSCQYVMSIWKEVCLWS
jgi:hypothetical protein